MFTGYYEDSLSMNQPHASSPEKTAAIAKFLGTKLFSSIPEDPGVTKKMEEAIQEVSSDEPPAYIFIVTEKEKPE